MSFAISKLPRHREAQVENPRCTRDWGEDEFRSFESAVEYEVKSRLLRVRDFGR